MCDLSFSLSLFCQSFLLSLYFSQVSSLPYLVLGSFVLVFSHFLFKFISLFLFWMLFNYSLSIFSILSLSNSLSSLFIRPHSFFLPFSVHSFSSLTTLQSFSSLFFLLFYHIYPYPHSLSLYSAFQLQHFLSYYRRKVPACKGRSLLPIYCLCNFFNWEDKKL
ncbi:unnamed protein product [Acanthosepion pharaonis]|uniref:Uncharacterized protein n=1 Tax=Acanthosepion pharaonis TaxID=158019 RepID=A0A812B922_ACAPH|nr:unnamed protein product [Sepia pharaonis]